MVPYVDEVVAVAVMCVVNSDEFIRCKLYR